MWPSPSGKPASPMTFPPTPDPTDCSATPRIVLFCSWKRIFLTPLLIIRSLYGPIWIHRPFRQIKTAVQLVYPFGLFSSSPGFQLLRFRTPILLSSVVRFSPYHGCCGVNFRLAQNGNGHKSRHPNERPPPPCLPFGPPLSWSNILSGPPA